MTAVNGHNPTDVGELRAEITRTREELGETIEALAAKTDVKARVKESVHDTVEDTKTAVRVKAAETKAKAVMFRHDPVGQTKLRADAVRRSITERPAPWIVAAALVAVATLVAMGKRARR